MQLALAEQRHQRFFSDSIVEIGVAGDESTKQNLQLLHLRGLRLVRCLCAASSVPSSSGRAGPEVMVQVKVEGKWRMRKRRAAESLWKCRGRWVESFTFDAHVFSCGGVCWSVCLIRGKPGTCAENGH